MDGRGEVQTFNGLIFVHTNCSRKTANNSKKASKGRQQYKSQKLFERKRGRDSGVDQRPNERFSGVSVDLLALTFDPDSEELPANFKSQKRYHTEPEENDEGLSSEDETRGRQERDDEQDEGDGQEEEEEREGGISLLRRDTRETPKHTTTIPTSYIKPHINTSSSLSSYSSRTSTTRKPVPPSPAVVSKAMQQMNDLVSILPPPPSRHISSSSSSSSSSSNKNTTINEVVSKPAIEHHNFNMDGIIAMDEYEDIIPPAILE